MVTITLHVIIWGVIGGLTLFGLLFSWIRLLGIGQPDAEVSLKGVWKWMFYAVIFSSLITLAGYSIYITRMQ